VRLSRRAERREADANPDPHDAQTRRFHAELTSREAGTTERFARAIEKEAERGDSAARLAEQRSKSVPGVLRVPPGNGAGPVRHPDRRRESTSTGRRGSRTRR
jgi:hypothetical protein